MHWRASLWIWLGGASPRFGIVLVFRYLPYLELLLLSRPLANNLAAWRQACSSVWSV